MSQKNHNKSSSNGELHCDENLDDTANDADDNALSNKKTLIIKKNTLNHVYHDYCSFKKVQQAIDSIKGKNCTHLCNENCLFCKTEHHYNNIKIYRNKRFYKCRYCQAKIQLITHDNFTSLLIANEKEILIEI